VPPRLYPTQPRKWSGPPRYFARSALGAGRANALAGHLCGRRLYLVCIIIRCVTLSRSSFTSLPLSPDLSLHLLPPQTRALPLEKLRFSISFPFKLDTASATFFYDIPVPPQCCQLPSELPPGRLPSVRLPLPSLLVAPLPLPGPMCLKVLL
jgi:hypothetical protein